MTDALLRVLIVDDEELGRDVLRLRLELVPHVEIIGEAGNGREAAQAILDLRPDVVFLDVQMPGFDGFGVVEAVADEYLPSIIFVTAHDDYAIQAFEHHALDYLLKPVAPSRLLAALERARVALVHREVADIHARVTALLDQREMEAARGTGPAPGSGAGPGAGGTAEGVERLQRIVVREKEDYRIVKVADVVALEAAGNYVRVVLDDRNYLVRGTLVEYERALDPRRFARIHRSTIVGLDRIERVSPQPHGDFMVTLEGGHEYRMSRTFRDRVLP